MLSATPVISEFLARNDSILADEDGDYSDWIEIHNPTPAAVDLGGWYLTDSAANLTKWQFPAITIDPGAFLLVFASSKDRSDPLSELHTNFALNGGGEYLGLVQPDHTVVQEFSPEYPPQENDLSFGLVFDGVRLVTQGSLADVLIPTSSADLDDDDPDDPDDVPSAWYETTFGSDTEWLTVPLGAGFGINEPGFTVRFIDVDGGGDGLINTVTETTNILDGNVDPADYLIATDITERRQLLDFAGGGGTFTVNQPYLDGSTGTGLSDIAIRATAVVTIPEGDWTVGFGSDDGGRLQLAGVPFFGEAGTNGDTPGDDEIRFNRTRGHGWTTGQITVGPGGLSTRIVTEMFERGGGDSFEVAIRAGHHNNAVSAADWTLLSDGALGWSVKSQLTDVVQTDLETEMRGSNATALFRSSFDVADVGSLDSLSLDIQYNDGFVAYLNGVEVARRNAPAVTDWDSAATASRTLAETLTYESINLSSSIGLLHNGVNLLAIQGLNSTASDATFLVYPELIGGGLNAAPPSFFSVPTPGTINSESFFGRVADTKFSVDRGLYSSPFTLEITTETESASIYYTTDGSEPSETNGILFSAPIPINQTTAIRARAFRPGFEPSNIDTQTYLFLADVVQQSPHGETPANFPDPPSVNGQVLDYGMDPDIVNDPQWGPQLEAALRQVPSFSIVTDIGNVFDPSTGIYVNPGGHGITWERPVSLELLNGPDGDQFQVEAGLRIRGGFSRSTNNPKHSFRVFFRDVYGDAKLNYPLFGDEGVASFDKFDFRTTQNYSWGFGGDARNAFVRDVFSRDAVREIGQPYTRSRYYHLYINGQYWGLYQTEERPSAAYAESYFGGKKSDYDVVKSGGPGRTVEATDGNLDAYNRLAQAALNGFSSNDEYFRIQGMNTDGTRNPAYERVLDVDNLIDYMLMTFFTGDKDGPGSTFTRPRPNNFFGIYKRTNPDGFKWFEHDSEHSLDTGDNDMVNPLLTTSYPTYYESNTAHINPHWIHERLMDNAEYAQRFADRAYQMYYNDGVLTEARNVARVQQRAAEFDLAMIAESARWGDAKRAAPHTQATWANAINQVINWFPGRSDAVIGQFRGVDWYPDAAVPEFTVNGTWQHGGQIDTGDQVAIASTPPSVDVYYTLDGTDPREIGGGTTAPLYANNSFSFTETTTVAARSFDSGEWSALTQATFYLDTPATAGNVAITEVHYKPYPPSATELAVDPDFVADDFEFLELHNLTDEVVDLTGARFTDGIEFDFAAAADRSLDPDEFVVVVRNSAAFQARYGTSVKIAGAYTGSLSNNGETIALHDRFGAVIHDFTYDVSGSWPGRADGKGSSLEVGDVGADYSESENWRNSTEFNGSPGFAGIGPRTSIVINEALAHTDLPQKDAIELFNTTAAEIDISGWYLSDSSDDYKKFRIPAGNSLAADQYLVFDEDDFNPTAGGSPNEFALNSYAGDDIWLLAANANDELTLFIDHVDFSASANGESFGRWPNGSGDLYPMTALTLGTENSGPRVGPLVISEIMYHPPDPGGGFSQEDLEFVEIFNPSDAAVSLASWTLEGGIDYVFSADTNLPSHGVIVVLPFDPESAANASRVSDFRSYYGIDDSVVLVGGYRGKLNNAGERVTLYRPDEPPSQDPTFVPLLIEDEARYLDEAPWPVEPDGLGPSLTRLFPVQWGNDPASWKPDAPSPGAVPAGQVVARHLFYNASAFDNGLPAMNAADDLAIADKTALLPGNAGTFSNYISHPDGITGVMVDVQGLGDATQLSANDFEFRAGVSSDPENWPTLASPSILVRPADGAGGSARVSFTWPAGTIVDRWLRVVVKPTLATGLHDADTFYFGSAVGDTGDTPANAAVNGFDFAGVRDNPSGTGQMEAITSRFDLNRDRTVDGADLAIVRDHPTTFLTSLRLLAAPAIPAPVAILPPPAAALNIEDDRIQVESPPQLVAPLPPRPRVLETAAPAVDFLPPLQVDAVMDDEDLFRSLTVHWE